MRAFFAAPASEQSLAQLYARHPDATIVAGATDVGLWITKKLAPIEKIIHVGRVAGLSAIEETARRLRARRDRFTGARRSRAGIDRSRHRRSAAPVRLDSGARLRHGRRQHRQRLADRRSRADADRAGSQRWSCARAIKSANLPLENFFLDYGKQDRQPGEFVRRLLVPKLPRATHFRAYKITKRFDEDISAVLAAFCLKIDDGRISEARVAFGGMAGIPKRAKAIEETLRGLSLNDTQRWQSAAEAVSKDFTPLTDLRASAAYRMPRRRQSGHQGARRNCRRQHATSTRIADHRMVADAAE